MLESLPRRRRGNPVAHLLHGLTQGRTPPPRERALLEPWLDALLRHPEAGSECGTPVTDVLHARLIPDDLARVRARQDETTGPMLAGASPADRRRLEIGLALHAGGPEVEERTGLLRAMPPDGVHVLGAEPWATGGSTYYADLVTAALEDTGGVPADGAALDFGCSSGRVVRVLAAVHPQLAWHGCDPLADAVGWATEHLPMATFAQSDHEPPLPYADGSFDVVYAISVWSHFRHDAALRWLDEMARVIRPGGRLLLTTQGWATLSHVGRHRLWRLEDVHETAVELVAEGVAYHDVFAAHGGDHGIVREDWGWSFMTHSWLAAHATPRWSVALHREGVVESSQDLTVLRLRDGACALAAS